MSSRSSVILTFQENNEGQVEEILNKHGTVANDKWKNSNGTVDFFFEEVKYGELHAVTYLQIAGIPYNVHNEEGEDYCAETKYCRYNEKGECVLSTIGNDDDFIHVEELLEIIDDHKALREYILACEKACNPPSWDNQEEYAARYRAIQALTPKPTAYD